MNEAFQKFVSAAGDSIKLKSELGLRAGKTLKRRQVRPSEIKKLELKEAYIEAASQNCFTTKELASILQVPVQKIYKLNSWKSQFEERLVEKRVR